MEQQSNEVTKGKRPEFNAKTERRQGLDFLCAFAPLRLCVKPEKTELKPLITRMARILNPLPQESRGRNCAASFAARPLFIRAIRVICGLTSEIRPVMGPAACRSFPARGREKTFRVAAASTRPARCLSHYCWPRPTSAFRLNPNAEVEMGGSPRSAAFRPLQCSPRRRLANALNWAAGEAA